MTAVSTLLQAPQGVSGDAAQVSGTNALRDILAGAARAGGFAGAVYMHFGHGLRGALDPTTRMAPRCVVGTSGFDEDQYLRRNYIEHDPLAARATEDLTPFAWSLAELEGAWPERRRFLGVMASWGMHWGVIAPVHDYALGPAFLNLYASGQLPERQDADFGFAMVAALHAHKSATKTMAASNEAAHEARLSPREMEVLRRAAMGCTEQETAIELALSRRGVQFHLARAVAKLGAANKTAAVARAVSVGLIRI
ncbi:MAG: autoinducer binding domain-containing protein [Caulobacteraceae bacterium]